ncbi:lipopolysaccharide assembly protein LapB [Alteromonas sp. LMIT006]|uniref:lipopolysaccharide assembly protein LapB n=1 Tax=Alteromonadaceae TaxID=72275 RepID=UPI0020CA742A|nr:lipopolysaccharide assembly protein LapB [Alteromonas sp. LMIT006]UTP72045.1 lipopolysaccharide assembly protein LapB [Alteromonas sp. LMIT006]
MPELVFLLLPVTVWYGWIMGRNSVRKAQRKQSTILSRHYYKGLNFLLSDQPDKAVDTFIKMISLNNDTVETHIAMGNFFRHRGELDRAIRIHQNLVSRDELQGTPRENALAELGRDYMLAGFLERAENAFIKLLDSDKHRSQAQEYLFEIYQTTKEWDKAIELAQNMLEIQSENELVRTQLAHFYCEMANQCIKLSDFSEAYPYLRKAVDVDKTAVRPWLMLGRVYIEQEQYRDAVKALNEVPGRDMSWFSEAVPLLEQCAKALSDDEVLRQSIEPHWDVCATSYLAKVTLLAKEVGDEAASETLLKQLQKRPTMRGFNTLLGLFVERQQDNNVKESLNLLQQLVSEQIKARPKYRCTRCGFSGRQVYWLCPSCKHWSVVKPIKGLDGE